MTDADDALEDLGNALELVRRDGAALAISAATDRLAAIVRDNPDDVYLAAILHTATTIRLLAESDQPQAREQVHLAVRTLKIIATARYVLDVGRLP